MVPSLRHGISQKNNADILLVIDALEVAYTNPLIDSFCIVSGDSDYTPLVGKLKSMGKFVLGISRSEAASSIFINACNEFQFLENVGGRSRKPNGRKKAATGNEDKEPLDEQELNKLIESILDEQTGKRRDLRKRAQRRPVAPAARFQRKGVRLLDLREAFGQAAAKVRQPVHPLR